MTNQHQKHSERLTEKGRTNAELAYAGINTFLKSSHCRIQELSDESTAVLGVPYDSAVSNRPGARYGPNAIRRASSWWAYLSGYKGGLTNMETEKTVDFSNLSLSDCGDVPVFPMDRERTAESIEAHVAAVAEQTFPVLLGGDHYCTFPSFCGFAKGSGHKRVGLVQIDAHTDTSEKSPIFGEHFHGSSTQQIATSGYSDYDHISQIAIRGYEAPSFFDFAEQTGLSVHTMRDVEQRGIRAIVSDAIDAAAKNTDSVYVTFDIDSVDPSIAPGTGTPEPGGLTAQQALIIMEMLGNNDNVGAVDMMEVSPKYDHSEGTQRLAAYLLVTFLERRFAENE